MVKEHTHSERRNLLLPLHGLNFCTSSKGYVTCVIPQTENTSQPLLHLTLHILSDVLSWRYIWLHHSSMYQQLHDYMYPHIKEGRKEVFYLTMHSTLNTFSYGYMVSEIWYHSDSERGNPLPPHGLLFPISSKGCFICTIPQTG